MSNEGILVNDSKTLMKSAMIRALDELGEMTPKRWQEVVFEVLTGERVDDIDWEVEDNHAGYFTWIRSFDGLAGELIDDGYVRAEHRDGQDVIVALENDDAIDYSQLVHGRI